LDCYKLETGVFMPRRILLILSLFLVCGVLSSQPSAPSTPFGIRHDKSLREYERVAISQNSGLPDFRPVVFFTYTLEGDDENEILATGTLIHPRWILTAGHNFYDAAEQSRPVSASAITVYTGPDPNNPQAQYEAETLVPHPTWISYNEGYLYANDIYLVKLKTPIQNITPALLYQSTDEQLGSLVWTAGFGDYSTQPGEDEFAYSKLHAIQNRLDRVARQIWSDDGERDYEGGLLAFDFDDPSGTINTLGDDYICLDEEELLGKGTSENEALEYEGTTVQGDSGSPLFLKQNGVWKVAGVLSGGAEEPLPDHQDGSYGDISIFIRVSLLSDWILEVISN
jgi:V8-like Glu-specific endopeptidase